MKKNQLILIIFFILLTISSNAQNYTFKTIQPPDALTDTTFVYDINNRGEVVGSYERYYPDVIMSKKLGFYYDGKKYKTLDYPGATFSELVGLNNIHHFIGIYQKEGILHGYFYDNNNFQDIKHPDANNMELSAINDNDHIVGMYTDLNDQTNSFYYDGTTFLPVRFPGAILTIVQDINDKDEIVGYYQDESYQFYGFIYKNNKYETLNYPGSEESILSGINNIDKIFGNYKIEEEYHEFVYYRGKFVNFDYPGAIYVELTGINDQGQISGIWINEINTQSTFVATPIKLIGDVNIDGWVDLIDVMDLLKGISNLDANQQFIQK